MKKLSTLSMSLLFASLIGLPVLDAQAYIGPGAGLTAIGTVIALIGGILLGIVGFVWYPIKRLLKAKRQPATQPQTTADTELADDESAAAARMTAKNGQ